MIDFERVFRESRVVASRHLSYEEKEAVLDEVKTAIENQNLEILPREKNYNFMRSQGISERDAYSIMYDMTPDQLIGVLPNKNKTNDELYLFSVRLDKQTIYIKVAFDGDECKVISFHDQNEKIFLDYRGASDYEDNNFVKIYAGLWKTAFNKRNFNIHGQDIKIKSYFVKGDVIHFDFNTEVHASKLFNKLLMTCQPYGMGHKIYSEPEFVGGGVEVELAQY